MPLNENDRAWIRQEVQAAHRRHGLGKLTGFIKDWSGAGGCIAILLFAFTQWTAYVEFRTDTRNKLEGIDKNMATLGLQSHASLPQPIFETTLPELKATFATAYKQNVRVSPQVIEHLQTRLLGTSPGASEFWPTVSEFISYRSMVVSTSPDQTRILLTEKLADCIDSLPKPMTIKEVLGPHEIVPNRGSYEHCRITLDSPRDDEVLNKILSGNTPLITFKDCLVVYRGGQISLILAWEKSPFLIRVQQNIDSTPEKIVPITLSDQTIKFENCLFDFSFRTIPPPQGQQLSTILLAQNTATIELPSAK